MKREREAEPEPALVPPRFVRVGVERKHAWAAVALVIALIAFTGWAHELYQYGPLGRVAAWVLPLAFAVPCVALQYWRELRSARAAQTDAARAAQVPDFARAFPLRSASWLSAPWRVLSAVPGLHSLAQPRILTDDGVIRLESRWGTRTLSAREILGAVASPSGIQISDMSGRRFTLGTCRPPRALGPSGFWNPLAQAVLDARYASLSFNEAVLERLRRATGEGGSAYRGRRIVQYRVRPCPEPIEELPRTSAPVSLSGTGTAARRGS